jgi:hypothetical protein
MKKLFYFSLCLLLTVACKQSDVAPQTETAKNKATITFGNIKHGDWIQIDDLPQLPHLLDTMRIRYFNDGSAFFRWSYPQIFPMEYLEDYLWISQTWGIGGISNQWIIFDDKLGGMPSYSLFYHLVKVRKLAYLYEEVKNTEARYKITFNNFTTKEAFLDYENNYMLMEDFKKLSTIVIERLDGKPIRIQTSQGYDAKIEYQ